MTEKTFTYKHESGRGFGMILIALGALFLLGSLNVLDIGDTISLWWPAILILWGAARFAQSRFHRWGSLIPVIIGILFLLSNFDLISIEELWKLWPIALIWAGIEILFKRRREHNRGINEVTDSDDIVSQFVAFSGVNRVHNSSSFKGGTLTAIFGGIEIDFTNARLAQGRHELVVTTIFGGVELRVPETWNIKLEATPIFGGVDNHARTASDAIPSSELVINATAIFGGVEIKN